FHFFFSSRRRHTISKRDWSSDVCSSDLNPGLSFLAVNLSTTPQDWLKTLTSASTSKPQPQPKQSNATLNQNATSKTNTSSTPAIKVSLAATPNLIKVHWPYGTT